MNIVSIDFDIIMAPSIEFYNNMVRTRSLFNDPLLQVCNADLEHYRRLTDWLIKNKKNDNVVIIKSHERIVNHISGPEDVIINIDHHHDLGYDFHTNEEDKITKINCGNWAEYLLSNNLIKKYVWINNENSI